MHLPLIFPAKEELDLQDDFNRFLFQLKGGTAGTRVRAWFLLAGQNFKVDFHTFVRGCRRIGFGGGGVNFKSFWRRLVGDSAMLTLEAFAPEEAAKLAEFREVVLKVFATLEDFWERCLDKNRSGRCSWEEFRDGCAEILHFEDPKEIFDLIDYGREGDITLDEMGILALPRRQISSLTLREKLHAQGMLRAKQSARVVERFRAFLRKQFGTLAAAWQTILAPGRPELLFREFCVKARSIGIVLPIPLATGM